MLAEFQQALADLTASPELCRGARADPGVLSTRYDLTERERHRLLAILNHPGMACACTVYRMNRVAPLAMNLRATLRALGPALKPLLAAYWREHPYGYAHFHIETANFCAWLRSRLKAGEALPPEVTRLLDQEGAVVQAALEASRTGASYQQPN